MIKTNTSRGFSLVEVAVALGVVSFAILALLGLVVASHNTAREGVDKTDNSLLFEKVVNQLRLKPFTVAQTGSTSDRNCYPLPALNASGAAEPFFVDEQYRYVGMGTDMDAKNQASKVVRIVVMNAASLELDGAQTPGLTSDGQLAYVRIEVSGPAAGYREDTFAAPNKEVFDTEINLTEQ
jgi:uncharacterized protein (TIGR02598 family)